MGVFDEGNKVWTREQILAEQFDQASVESKVAIIKPLLAGIGPKKQGFILADLAAIWMTGFHPEPVRHEMKTMFLTTLSELVEHYEAGGSRPT